MVLDPSSTIAVVGASLAGLRAAETLRAEGHAGTDRPRRRRAPPALRPPPAVEAVPGRHVGARSRAPATVGEDHRPRARPAPGTPGRRPRRRRAHPRARRREHGALRRAGPRHRRASPPAAGHGAGAGRAHPADARGLPGARGGGATSKGPASWWWGRGSSGPRWPPRVAASGRASRSSRPCPNPSPACSDPRWARCAARCTPTTASSSSPASGVRRAAARPRTGVLSTGSSSTTAPCSTPMSW